jgi:hypothetical protein
MKFKVQNWPEQEAGLKRRGSLTLWIDDAALAQWQSIGLCGRARQQSIAIETCLMLRAAFKMALRPTEGFMASVLTLNHLTVLALGYVHERLRRNKPRLPSGSLC